MITHCPECGEPLRTVVRVRRSLEFVDNICDFCEWADIDHQGGNV